MKNSFRDQNLNNRNFIFLILSAFFICSLVLTNLIAGRFFTFRLDFLNIDWALSSGVLIYPVTFLVTDVISEIYGEKTARSLVFTGFLISIFTLCILLLSANLPIWEKSPVDFESYNNVFGLAPGIVFGSMIAYLTAQFIDVKVFEFLRKQTNGRHLWLRNNGSTIFSQLVDTSFVVVIALILYPKLTGVSEVISWGTAFHIIIGQYAFKALIAIFDTPLVYLMVYLLNRIED